MARTYDPAKHCGAAARRTGLPCTQPAGHRTDHQGFGQCWLHYGRTVNAAKAAAKEMAQAALAKLGVPSGTGDPFVLLEKSVRHAEGYLEATGQVLAEVAAKDSTDKGFSVEAAAQLYADAIRSGARVGKAAVDADVAERRAVLDERAGNLLQRFVRELIERVAPLDQRPSLEAWAATRLAEMALEYERIH
jgi:hypothetical protein